MISLHTLGNVVRDHEENQKLIIQHVSNQFPSFCGLPLVLLKTSGESLISIPYMSRHNAKTIWTCGHDLIDQGLAHCGVYLQGPHQILRASVNTVIVDTQDDPDGCQNNLRVEIGRKKPSDLNRIIANSPFAFDRLLRPTWVWCPHSPTHCWPSRGDQSQTAFSGLPWGKNTSRWGQRSRTGGTVMDVMVEAMVDDQSVILYVCGSC